MSTFIDLTGQVFGRLTVRKCVGRTKCGSALWLCRCECGTDTIVRAGNVKSGTSQSCGCLAKEVKAENGKQNTKHGHSSANGDVSPTYHSWSTMLTRCTNPNSPNWKVYGGATPPVLVLSEWLSFENFLASMGERPAGTSLGRILDRGDYEPGNAFWQTRAEQSLAKRNNYALLRWENQNVTA